MLTVRGAMVISYSSIRAGDRSQVLSEQILIFMIKPPCAAPPPRVGSEIWGKHWKLRPIIAKSGKSVKGQIPCFVKFSVV